MKIIHLGENRFGRRILRVLTSGEDHVQSVTSPAELADALVPGEIDWLVSAGYRHKVSNEVLVQVPNNCNLHTALLPYGRGANPNVWMLAHQEPAGVSIHRMVEALDKGPLFAQRHVQTTFADRAFELYQRLEDELVRLFAEVWPAMRSGALTPSNQPRGGSNHLVKDMKDLGHIDLEASITWREALNTLRALTFPPYENAIVTVDRKRYVLELNVREARDQT